MEKIYINKKEDVVLKEGEYKEFIFKKAQKLWEEMDEDCRENYDNKFDCFLYMTESREKDWDYDWIETERYKKVEDLNELWCHAVHFDNEMDENWEGMIKNKKIIAQLTKSWYISFEFEVVDITDRAEFAEIKFIKAEIKNK